MTLRMLPKTTAITSGRVARAQQIGAQRDGDQERHGAERAHVHERLGLEQNVFLDVGELE